MLGDNNQITNFMQLFFISKFLSSQSQGVQNLTSNGQGLSIIIEAAFSGSNSKSSDSVLKLEGKCKEIR